MIVIASVNLKGGVGKTSLCHHLGGTLAKGGRRVLLVDCDPQSSLTQGVWGPRVLRELPASRTVAAVYGNDPIPERVIHATGIENLWLIPGHEEATAWNMMPVQDWGDAPDSLRTLLWDVRDEYDYALVDCPPNLHLCTFTALMSATHVVIPLQSEDYGAQGMVAVNRAISQVQAQRGGWPVLLGYLLTMYDKRLKVHQVYAENLRELYGDSVLECVMPFAKDFKEAVALRKPISHLKDKGTAVRAMRALAEEIERRIGGVAEGVAA